MEHTGRVFGVGLSRTGTTSLAEALALIGYDSVHAESFSDIEMHQAASDTPVAARYRLLDQWYPNSKFILTVREIDSWIEACRKHWASYSLYEIDNTALAIEYSFCRGAIYHIDFFDPDLFRAAYEEHVEGVRAYFRDRPDDLLELNIIAGEGFEKLCPFLGKPVPDVPFPRSNVGRVVRAKGMAQKHFEAAALAFDEGQDTEAEEHIRAALDAHISDFDDKWILGWVASAAMDAHHYTPDQFVDVVFDHLPPEAANLQKLRSQAHSEYHMAAAFDAYEHHDKHAVRQHALPAVRANPRALRNRGLMAIILKSLIGG